MKAINKQKFYILVAILFLSGCTNAQPQTVSQEDSTVPLKVEIKIEKEYELKFSKKRYLSAEYKDYYKITTDSVKEKRYDIKVEIKNNFTRSIFFWLMTCSWEDNFIVNNDYIYMLGEDCDHNFPTMVEIKSGESKIYSTTLRKSIKFDYPCQYCIYGPQVETTKLGLIVINNIINPESWDYDDYEVLMHDKSKWKMVWSNPLYLLANTNPIK